MDRNFARALPLGGATHVKRASGEAAINAERQRRIVAGKAIDGVYVTGRDEDARNLTNLAMAAQRRIGQDDVTTPTVYRDGANVDHELTPPQMLALWQQSAEYVSALYAASWAIKGHGAAAGERGG